MAVTVTTQFVTDKITMSSVLTGGEVTGETVGDFLPIVDLLMKSKFQYSNVSRQKITSEIKTGNILKPFQLFHDDKQTNKPFLLTSYTMSVLEDMYTIELTEYNNTDIINIT